MNATDATITAGGTFSQGGSFTDPDADTWTATVDYGDGAGPAPLARRHDLHDRRANFDRITFGH